MPHLIPWSLDQYPLIERWYRGHESEPVPETWLPVQGALAGELLDQEEGGFQPQVAAWYSLDPLNGISHLEFLVTNPTNTVTQSREASAAVLDFLAHAAMADGARVLFATVRNEALAIEGERLGFERTAEGIICIARSLNT